jgi:hypothetical protein
MKFYLDTEFHEFRKQPKVLGIKVGKPINTIELISIGIVAEDGRELYIVSNEFDVKAAWDDKWLRDNVLWPIFRQNTSGDARNEISFDLQGMKRVIGHIGKPRLDMACDIMVFMGHSPEVYAYFADYDWVVTCWIFGRMVDLPVSFPFFCMDLKQMMAERGLDGTWKDLVCPQGAGKHDALEDARWNRQLHEAILRTQQK